MTTSTHPRLTDTPPPTTTPTPIHVTPLRLIDRAALHVGIALIRWGRRHGRAIARAEALRRAASSPERAEQLRQREMAHTAALSVVHTRIR